MEVYIVHVIYHVAFPNCLLKAVAAGDKVVPNWKQGLLK